MKNINFEVFIVHFDRPDPEENSILNYIEIIAQTGWQEQTEREEEHSAVN